VANCREACAADPGATPKSRPRPERHLKRLAAAPCTIHETTPTPPHPRGPATTWYRRRQELSQHYKRKSVGKTWAKNYLIWGTFCLTQGS
jgi:hypothetical protein